MKICAIILDYRGAKKTEACLHSLISEGIDTVILVDNSAQSSASEELGRVVMQLKAQGVDYHLQTITPKINLGFAGGVNLAIEDAAGQHCDAILLLNNDASVVPGSIALMATALANREADLIAPSIVDDHGTPQPMMWYHRFFGLLTDHALPGSFPYLSGSCILFRRDLIVGRKLFDEHFFMYGEDTLLGWEMTSKKKTFLQLKTATVRHTGQVMTGSCTLFYEYHMARAHLLLALKTWRHPVEIPLLLAGKSLGLILRAGLRCIRYRSGVPFLAIFLAWLPLDLRKT